MEDLQQQLNRQNRKFNRIIIILVIIMLLVVLGAVIVIDKSRNDVDRSNLQVQILTDSMIARDSRRLVQDSIQQHIIDSALGIAYSAQSKVDKVPAMISAVKQRYDIQRNHITALSDDEQFSLLASWLNETDSL